MVMVVGNWKMNGNRAANAPLLDSLKAARRFAAEVAVCVPAPYLAETVAALAGSAIGVGAQDCSAHAAGAYTGETAASMLADVGCRLVIVGHSERRALHGESDAAVAEKALRALDAGLRPIACVGETLAEREGGRTDEVVSRQLGVAIERLADRTADAAAGLIVAYEPVWAIGTGRTATVEQVGDVHARLHAMLADARLDRVPVLYGGSVKPDNAGALFATDGVDGGLVGGASLNARDFIAICNAAPPARRTTTA